MGLYFCKLFQLKELEKMGPKRGVISQSVKDVIQSLVDDDLVAKDKIGISVSSYCSYVGSFDNLFYLFPYSPCCFYMSFDSVHYFANEDLLLEPSQLCWQSSESHHSYPDMTSI